ncbi:Transcription-repair-coupling factor [bacterium HR21]|nr:Transcription-repair-coupling factor [bacterium HR21]
MERIPLAHLSQRLGEQLWERFGKAIAAGESFPMPALAGSLGALVGATAWQRLRRPLLVVAPSAEEVARWHYDLLQLCPEAQVVTWNWRPKQLWEQVRHVDALQLEGVEVAFLLQRRAAPIVVCSPEVFTVPIPEPAELERWTVRLQVGMELPREEFLQALLHRGFQRVEQVSAVGDVAWRGGIVDIFPIGWQEPLRIELWGNTVESLRCFDPESQRSTVRFEHVEFLASLVWEQPVAQLTRFLPPETLVILDHPEQLRHRWAQQGAERLVEDLQRWQVLMVNPLSAPGSEPESIGQPSVGGSVLRLLHELCRLQERGTELYLCAASVTHLRRLHQLLMAAVREQAEAVGEESRGDGLAQKLPSLHWVEGTLARGFLWHAGGVAVWTEHEIFGRLHRRPPERRRTAGLTLRELQQLKRGDYLVHVDHGIALFDGLQVLTLGAGRQECVRLLYADGDVLYVPLNYLHKLQRYEVHEGVKPKLHRLGSREWQALKLRAKRRLKDIARELVRLYARRKLQRGFAFPPDTLWQKEMEAAFPYEDTPDQARATAEVKADMEAPVPMDRLICGDVGFGKTEIAIRAAFKAVQAGKQVAVLVPTTVLAEQHFQTFSERLRPYPVVIATLSRFRSRREQREILQQLARGHIDIIIGTHRLLSADVRFRDLGLLIVDEEHRFGVLAKERLRKLHVNVDTLWLTATPIPRTLHMALIGVRDMSLIETPPQNRLPVRTYVVQWDDELIRTAIEAELDRGGQVFFVTNHIEGIEQLHERLQRLVPQARIGIAHGRLRSRQLEAVMEGFLRQQLDILLCTKIVEAGLDFPHANTILIHHAEDFGLAELYQLRGRVGRSNVQAYCYLIVPPVEQLTTAALRRLQALEEFTELGSGFRLALRDLEIRGAGNLFGPEQSGFIAQMGFELYQHVLERAIEELRAEEFPELERHRVLVLQALRNPGLQLDIPGEAFLPETYVPSDGERFALYKRLYRAESEAEVEDLAAELQDRFGPLPEPARALLEAVRLRVYLVQTGCVRVLLRPERLALELPARRHELFYRHAFPVWVEVVARWEGARFVQERQRLWAEFPLAKAEDALVLARLLWEELVCALHGVEVETVTASLSEETP